MLSTTHQQHRWLSLDDERWTECWATVGIGNYPGTESAAYKEENQEV